MIEKILFLYKLIAEKKIFSFFSFHKSNHSKKKKRERLSNKKPINIKIESKNFQEFLPTHQLFLTINWRGVVPLLMSDDVKAEIVKSCSRIFSIKINRGKKLNYNQKQTFFPNDARS